MSVDELYLAGKSGKNVLLMLELFSREGNHAVLHQTSLLNSFVSQLKIENYSIDDKQLLTQGLFEFIKKPRVSVNNKITALIAIHLLNNIFYNPDEVMPLLAKNLSRGGYSHRSAIAWISTFFPLLEEEHLKELNTMIAPIEYLEFVSSENKEGLLLWLCINTTFIDSLIKAISFNLKKNEVPTLLHALKILLVCIPHINEKQYAVFIGLIPGLLSLPFEWGISKQLQILYSSVSAQHQTNIIEILIEAIYKELPTNFAMLANTLKFLPDFFSMISEEYRRGIIEPLSMVALDDDDGSTLECFKASIPFMDKEYRIKIFAKVFEREYFELRSKAIECLPSFISYISDTQLDSVLKKVVLRLCSLKEPEPISRAAVVACTPLWSTDQISKIIDLLVAEQSSDIRYQMDRLSDLSAYLNEAQFMQAFEIIRNGLLSKKDCKYCLKKILIPHIAPYLSEELCIKLSELLLEIAAKHSENKSIQCSLMSHALSLVCKNIEQFAKTMERGATVNKDILYSILWVDFVPFLNDEIINWGYDIFIKNRQNLFVIKGLLNAAHRLNHEQIKEVILAIFTALVEDDSDNDMAATCWATFSDLFKKLPQSEQNELQDFIFQLNQEQVKIAISAFSIVEISEPSIRCSLLKSLYDFLLLLNEKQLVAIFDSQLDEIIESGLDDADPTVYAQANKFLQIFPSQLNMDICSLPSSNKYNLLTLLAPYLNKTLFDNIIDKVFSANEEIPAYPFSEFLTVSAPRLSKGQLLQLTKAVSNSIHKINLLDEDGLFSARRREDIFELVCLLVVLDEEASSIIFKDTKFLSNMDVDKLGLTAFMTNLRQFESFIDHFMISLRQLATNVHSIHNNLNSEKHKLGAFTPF